MSFEDTKDYLVELSLVLHSDIKIARDKIGVAREEELPFYLRSYLRAFGSWAEGTLVLHKKLLRECVTDCIQELPIASQLYLTDFDWKVNRSGLPEKSEKKIRTLDNLKGFFVVSGQLFDCYQSDFGAHGWGRVVDFYKLRNSMMHPSGPESLTVSRKQISDCDDGRKWLDEEFREVRTCLIAERGKRSGRI